MRNRIACLLKHLLAAGLVAALDLAISLPIMGATYRPFSWMSITEPDIQTLYPVIRDIALVPVAGDGEHPTGRQISCDAAAGEHYLFQRSTNLMDPGAWHSIGETTSVGNTVSFVDTNPLSHAVFYRVQHRVEAPGE